MQKCCGQQLNPGLWVLSQWLSHKTIFYFEADVFPSEEQVSSNSGKIISPLHGCFPDLYGKYSGCWSRNHTAFQTFQQQYLCGGKGILQASEGVGLWFRCTYSRVLFLNHLCWTLKNCFKTALNDGRCTVKGSHEGGEQQERHERKNTPKMSNFY